MLCVYSQADYKSQLEAAGNKLVVILFSSANSGPSRVIAPTFEKLSNNYSNVVMLQVSAFAFYSQQNSNSVLMTFHLQVDADECKSSSFVRDIRGLPHFRFIRNGVTIDRFTGAIPYKLEHTIIQHM